MLDLRLSVRDFLVSIFQLECNVLTRLSIALLLLVILATPGVSRTGLCELEKPDPGILEQMARLDCASAGIFHGESLTPDGKWIRPIGTGPFIPGEAIRGQRLDVDQFAEYRSRPGPGDGMTEGKTPLVDKVRLLNLPIEKIFDPTERQGLLDQLDQRVVADLPMIPLWSSHSLTPHHKEIKGYQPWAAGTPRYWGVSIE